jgi:DNA-binding transcriptional ArsR family regulator
MGRTWETKMRILRSLSECPKTSSTLAVEIGVSPSTMSQHLKELLEMGKVEVWVDEHFRSIRHYGLARTEVTGPVIPQVAPML